MKTHSNLFSEIITFENLFLAQKKAQKGKRKNENVAKFNLRLERELFLLQEQLLNKTYQPGKYAEFYIYEPKKRMISAAPYRDRVVHHALCNIIEPIFDKLFIFDTYANRKGKGTHAAIRRFKEFSKKNKYVIKADIRKYFPSIVHSILKTELRKTIKCKDTLWLIDLIIDNSNPQEFVNHWFEGDNLFSNLENKKGLPMGNLTSQFFANIYLSAFDHFVKRELKCKFYIRYVDDFVIFENSKPKCNEIIAKINQFLAQYRLKLHHNKTKIMQTEKGISFLGHRIFPNFTLINKQNIKKAIKRLDKKYNLLCKEQITKADFVNSYIAWYGHVINANSFLLRNKINSKFASVFWDEPFFEGVVFRNIGVNSTKDCSSRRFLEQQQ